MRRLGFSEGRRDAVVRRMIATLPKPHKPPVRRPKKT
jgi:hypothetical protein